MNKLSRLEAVVDEPELAAMVEELEVLMPTGVRERQCSLRTLFIGMMACLADGHRNAHLRAVHDALVNLADADRKRLGVVVAWKRGPHLLTYRQVAYTVMVLTGVLRKDRPDGAPSQRLQHLCDLFVESSVPEPYKAASGSYAIDWTDVESFSRPPTEPEGPCADPEAAWGHRRGRGPGQHHELFFGYYGSLMTMVTEDGNKIPELIRRAQFSSCRHDPVPSFVTVVCTSAASGVVVHEVLADCGYSYKVPGHFAAPMRAIGADLVVDLHPGDRGPKGTFAGAICHNGNLYCPMTPPALLSLGPLQRGASPEETADHDEATAELARYKLGRVSREDDDGYHRVACPATLGKCRCPLRPPSMALSHQRPEILDPPAEAPRCCTQRTITVPAEVNAKTRQRHDYPSAAHRRSYARRSGAERSNSRLKDPAGINVSVRGWCKLMGVVPLAVFFACACVVVNLELLDSFEEHRRAAKAFVTLPKRRRPRRKTLADLAASANAPP